MKEENTEEVEEKFIPFYLHKVQIHIVSPHTTFPTMLLFIFFFCFFCIFLFCTYIVGMQEKRKKQRMADRDDRKMIISCNWSNS